MVKVPTAYLFSCHFSLVITDQGLMLKYSMNKKMFVIFCLIFLVPAFGFYKARRIDLITNANVKYQISLPERIWKPDGDFFINHL